jgi:hypothetical protein
VLFSIANETLFTVPFIGATYSANGKCIIAEFSVSAVFVRCAIVIGAGFISDVLRS